MAQGSSEVIQMARIITFTSSRHMAQGSSEVIHYRLARIITFTSSRHMAQGSSEVIHYRWLVLLPSLPLVIWHKVLQR